MSTRSRVQIGVDIGGTFTDLVLLDVATGRIAKEKVLTTAQDPSLGVLEGIRRILAGSNTPADAVERVIHGTTLVANAIIERKGVPTGLLTTAGFRDVLEIGRERRYDTNDLFIRIPPPLVPRRMRLEARERVGPDGSVIEALREDDVVRAAAVFREAGIQAIAVVFLHAFRNDSHERRASEILAELCPGVDLSLSRDVAPDIGEYERTSTTVANAYVLPLCRGYLFSLDKALREIGIPGRLDLMLSDGGTIDHETAARVPIRLVQSGPAGGAKAAGLIGALAGESNVMCLDIGGTTAKVCLIEDGRPFRAHEFEVARVYRAKKGSGLPLKVPVVDMIEIGAGGGSIAGINAQGVIQVGPQSAGSAPGPAAYGLGGSEPTVTDADLVLGYLGADSFLGGEMKLRVELAEAAIDARIAHPLGITVQEAAWGICQAANESMAQAASIHTLEKGRSIAKFSLVPIGGAGPVHVCDIARRIGVKRVICPPGAGVASAYGFLASAPAFAYSYVDVTSLRRADLRRVVEVLADQERQGRDLLRLPASADSAARVSLTCAIRYWGQGHEVQVAIPRQAVRENDRATILRLFLETYHALYGRVEEREEVELISWHLVVSGPEPRIDVTSGMADCTGDPRPASFGSRPVYFAEAKAALATPILLRPRLPPGTTFRGQAIVEERESTIVVPPGASVRVDDHFNLIVDLAVPERDLTAATEALGSASACG